MIGRVWPCHVAKIAGGTGRVRVFLITRPAMCGSAEVAFDIHALLSSARLLALARTDTKAAVAIFFICTRSPGTSRKQAGNVGFSSGIGDIAGNNRRGRDELAAEPSGQNRDEAVGIGLVVIDVG